MTDNIGTNSQHGSSSPGFADKLTAPLCYLSSMEAGWDGITAEAFYEPKELYGWIAPARTDISLILFTGGTLHMDQRQLNGRWTTHILREGEFILNSGVATPYEVGWKSLSAIPTQTLHLHFNKELLARTAEEVAGCDTTHLSLVSRSGFQDPLMMQIGFALWRELEQRSPMGNLYAQTAAQMIAVHLLRHHMSSTVSAKELSRGLTQPQVRKVLDFVLAHLSQSVLLETLAQQVSLSPYHFARLFRQTTGESPHQFVLRQRLENAQRLLKETELPLAHIALESGFANQSHLTRNFKRRFGLTPRTYRQIFYNTAHNCAKDKQE